MAKAKIVSKNVDLLMLGEQKWNELGLLCEAEILKPHQSKIVLESTGKAHIYGTDLTDQTNMQSKLVLMLADRSIVDIPFKVKDVNNFVMHSREEFVAVVKEIGGMIEVNRIKCARLRTQLTEAKTLEQLMAIKW